MYTKIILHQFKITPEITKERRVCYRKINEMVLTTRILRETLRTTVRRYQWTRKLIMCDYPTKIGLIVEVTQCTTVLCGSIGVGQSDLLVGTHDLFVIRKCLDTKKCTTLDRSLIFREFGRRRLNYNGVPSLLPSVSVVFYKLNSRRSTNDDEQSKAFSLIPRRERKRSVCILNYSIIVNLMS